MKFFSLAIAILMWRAVFSGQDCQSAPVVKPVVTTKAMAFELADVRLLDGPFKHSQELDHDYLLQLEPDRLLAWFRKEAGLKPRAAAYGGWESRGIAGHSLGHYLSACAEMYQATGDEKLRQRAKYIVGELALCQTANSNGYVAAIPDGKKIFSEISQGIVTSQGFDLNGGWVPFYTLHKEMAGLRDAYRLCGIDQALEVERKLADFIDGALAVIGHEQMQKILACEHGGMNEVLADLYADTGDKKYLKLSRRFYHEAVLTPLTQREDKLNGLHANTQIPKLIGLADLYELTGETNDLVAAEFFWERMVNHHSYVTGGNGLNEHLGEPDHLNDRLGEKTTETCNVYNMLKLTQHIFEWDARPAAADFYERALFNHILSSQHPENGSVIYNLTLAPGGKKRYETPFESFTCCVGTGMENHARHGAGIYFHTEDSLFVNLFIASEVDWKEKGIKLRQETRFPDEGKTTLIFQCEKPCELALRVRHPYWAGNGFGILVNGQPVTIHSTPSSYETISREWKTGDRVEINLPEELHLQTMPDNPQRAAILYGPLVLAGDLGPENDSSANQPDYVPVLLVQNRPLNDWLKPVAGQPCTFRTEDVGRPREVDLRPFFRIHDRRYSVYWDIFTADQWRARQADYEAAREKQRQLEARIVDFFQPGEMQPERDHNFSGVQSGSGEANGRKWRDAYGGGSLTWDMKVLPDKPMLLTITYWGGDGGERAFDILVNGKIITEQQLANHQPGKFFDVSYPLAADLINGKTLVSICLQAHPKQMAGGIYGARMVNNTERGTPTDLNLAPLRNPVWVSKDNLRDPSVLKTDGGYHVFYSRFSGQTSGWGDPQNWHIAEVFTKDFLTFTNDRNLSPAGCASPGDVVWWHGRWVLPYQTYPSKPTQLVFAESTNLIEWSAPRPFLTEALKLPWNEIQRVIDPSFVVAGDTLHCWFVGSAYRTNASGDKFKVNLMGHARTRDPKLAEWEILTTNAPLIGLSERAPDGVENTMVFRTGDHWTMIYSEGLIAQHLARATSPDLVNWKLEGLIEIPRQQWMTHKYGAPFVWRDGNQWLMILMGSVAQDRTTFGLLSSNDGQHWSLLPEQNIEPNR